MSLKVLYKRIDTCLDWRQKNFTIKENLKGHGKKKRKMLTMYSIKLILMSELEKGKKIRTSNIY